MFRMQTRRDPGATFDTYTGCQQRACHDSALGAPSHAQTQDNSDEQLRFKVLYEEKRVCDLWEHACPQSFVHKRCMAAMALNTSASARDRMTRVSRSVRACMLMNVSIHAHCRARARLHTSGPCCSRTAPPAAPAADCCPSQWTCRRRQAMGRRASVGM